MLAWRAVLPFREGKELQFQAQAFNLFNHANYYVQNGNGINQLQYNPIGTQLRRRRNAESDLLSGAQFGPGQFWSPAGNQPQRPSTRVAVLREVYVLGLG